MKKLDLSTKARWGAVFFFLTLMLCSYEAPTFAADSTHPDIKNSVARQLANDGLKAFNSGSKRLGLDLLRKAVDAEPAEGWAQYLLGRALLQTGDAKSAERHFFLARGSGPSDEVVLPSLFDAMIANHEERKLLLLFAAPNNDAKGKIPAKLFHGRAMASLSLGNVDEAAASMDQALALDRDSKSLLARAAIASRQNNSTLAKRLIDEAFARDPADGRVMLAKLGDLVQSGDNAAAMALSERILKIYPKDITSRALRVEVLLRERLDGKAKAELDTVAAMTPGTAMEKYYRALLLSRAGQSDAAWRIAQSLPPSYMSSKSYAMPLSQMAINSGHAEMGAAILAAALGKWPEEEEIRIRLAAMRMKEGSADSAVVILSPLKKTTNAQALDLLGQARLQTRDTAGALEALRRANEIQPKDPEITFHLVLALDRNGERSAAKTLLQKLLSDTRSFGSLQNARQLERSWR